MVKFYEFGILTVVRGQLPAASDKDAEQKIKSLLKEGQTLNFIQRIDNVKEHEGRTS